MLSDGSRRIKLTASMVPLNPPPMITIVKWRAIVVFAGRMRLLSRSWGNDCSLPLSNREKKVWLVRTVWRVGRADVQAKILIRDQVSLSAGRRGFRRPFARRRPRDIAKARNAPAGPCGSGPVHETREN